MLLLTSMYQTAGLWKGLVARRVEVSSDVSFQCLTTVHYTFYS